MRALVLGLALLGVPASAQVHVDGYWRSDGTYVQPHVRSQPNTNPFDNYSSKGNVNPHTGEQGTVEPYRMPTYRPYIPQTPNPYARQYLPPVPLLPPFRAQPYDGSRCRSSYGC